MNQELDEQQMMDSDFDEFTDSQILVLLIIDEGASSPATRLQKTALLYCGLYGSGRGHKGIFPYFSRGFSDDIEEAAENMANMGVLRRECKGYTLTEYGAKLRDYVLEEFDDVNQISRIENLKKAISGIPDRNLVGLTYWLYGEIATNPDIKVSVDRFNSTSFYDGILLTEYPNEMFEQKLRNGEPIRCRVGRDWQIRKDDACGRSLYE